MAQPSPPRIAARQRWDAAATARLHVAASNGDVAGITAALAARANACALEPETDTPPLTVAASAGHIAAVRALLAVPGIRIAQARPSDGKTALHVAVEEGHTEVVSLLLDASPDLAMVPDMDGWLPAHWAAYYGDPNVLRCLLHDGAQPSAQVSALTAGSDTPLTLALQMVGSRWSRQSECSDFPAVFQLLDAQGAAVAAWRDPRTGGTALHVVVQEAGPAACIPCLCALGVPASATTRQGAGLVTALHLAAALGLADHAAALLAAGVDVEAREEEAGATPLLLAAQAGHGAVVAVLLRDGKANAWAQDQLGIAAPAALLLGADAETPEILDALQALLHAAAADGKHGPEEGALPQPTTALHVAAKRSWAQALEVLLAVEAGSQAQALAGHVGSRDARLDSPLHTAARAAAQAGGCNHGVSRVIAGLLTAGADVHAGGAGGQTAQQLLDLAKLSTTG